VRYLARYYGVTAKPSDTRPQGDGKKMQF
jgi:hypothetical protein